MPSLPGSVATSWNPLSWVALKNAAISRGIDPGTVKGLTPTPRKAKCNSVIARLTAWYSFDPLRPVPEALSREELLDEAEALNPEQLGNFESISEDALRKTIVKAHSHLKSEHDMELAEDDSSRVSGELTPHPSSEDELEPVPVESLFPPGYVPATPPPAAVITSEDEDDPLDLDSILEHVGYPYCHSSG
jgi:hypothetical protein